MGTLLWRDWLQSAAPCPHPTQGGSGAQAVPCPHGTPLAAHLGEVWPHTGPVGGCLCPLVDTDGSQQPCLSDTRQVFQGRPVREVLGRVHRVTAPSNCTLLSPEAAACPCLPEPPSLQPGPVVTVVLCLSPGELSDARPGCLSEIHPKHPEQPRGWNRTERDGGVHLSPLAFDPSLSQWRPQVLVPLVMGGAGLGVTRRKQSCDL